MTYFGNWKNKITLLACSLGKKVMLEIKLLYAVSKIYLIDISQQYYLFG